MFTNWFGKSCSSLLSNTARSFSVPVVVSSSLSTVCNLPDASTVVLLRSKASTPRASPLCTRRISAGTLSSGIGKIALIGCSCVMTTMPFTSPGVT